MEQCLFVGSKKLGLACLNLLVSDFPGTVCAAVTLDDGADTRSELDNFLTFSKQAALPVHVVPHSADLRQYVTKYNPAMVFVCGWYRIISPDLLQVPKRGFVGIHNSLLPKYRGGAPVVWAMINGDRNIGFSIFRFEPGMDTGPVFAQRAVETGENDTVAEVLEAIEAAVLHELKLAYAGMLTGKLQPEPQTGTPSYAAQRRPEDGKINWNRPQQAVYDFIRAQSAPYPGAFSLLGGEKITFQRVKKCGLDYYGAPGQVTFGPEGEILIICGDNKPLQVEEVWVNGRKVPPKDIFRSLQLRID